MSFCQILQKIRLIQVEMHNETQMRGHTHVHTEGIHSHNLFRCIFDNSTQGSCQSLNERSIDAVHVADYLNKIKRIINKWVIGGKKICSFRSFYNERKRQRFKVEKQTEKK